MQSFEAILKLGADAWSAGMFFFRNSHLSLTSDFGSKKQVWATLPIALSDGFSILEAYSIQKGKQKSPDESANDSLIKENEYLSLRLKIHSTFPYLTLGAYTLGFLFLLPEFSVHTSSFWMGAMVNSYFVPGIILTLVIRKNVQKELRELRMVI